MTPTRCFIYVFIGASFVLAGATPMVAMAQSYVFGVPEDKKADAATATPSSDPKKVDDKKDDAATPGKVAAKIATSDAMAEELVKLRKELTSKLRGKVSRSEFVKIRKDLTRLDMAVAEIDKAKATSSSEAELAKAEADVITTLARDLADPDVGRTIAAYLGRKKTDARAFAELAASRPCEQGSVTVKWSAGPHGSIVRCKEAGHLRVAERESEVFVAQAAAAAAQATQASKAQGLGGGYYALAIGAGALVGAGLPLALAPNGSDGGTIARATGAGALVGAGIGALAAFIVDRASR